MPVFKVRIGKESSEKTDFITVKATDAVAAMVYVDEKYSVTESGWEVIDAKEVRPKKVANG
jgi:hypothetical protein